MSSNPSEHSTSDTSSQQRLRPTPRRSSPQRCERLYEQYPWLEDFDPPEANPIQWKMLTPSEVAHFMKKHYHHMSRSSYYRDVYPYLHKCQHGYDPRESEEKTTKRLWPIPRWVMMALIEDLRLR